MSNKEYKIEVIDAPTNEVIEKDKDEKSWFYKNIGVAVNEFDKQDKLDRKSVV